MRHAIVMLGIFLTLTGCAHIPEDFRTPLDNPALNETYTLQIDDKIKITCSDKTLASEYLVQPDGTIHLLSIPPLMVENLSVTQIEGRLSQIFFSRKIKRFDVTLTVAADKRIHVYGQVRRPGTYTFKNKINVLRALDMAGGPEPIRANISAIRVIHPDVNGPRIRFIDLDDIRYLGFSGPDILLEDGDIIYIKRTFVALLYDCVQTFFYPFKALIDVFDSPKSTKALSGF